MSRWPHTLPPFRRISSRSEQSRVSSERSSRGYLFYIQSLSVGGSTEWPQAGENPAPNLCDGWKSKEISEFLWQKSPPEEITDGFGFMCLDSTGLRPWGVLSFLKQSVTQVPLLLLVKAHHSLNVHTTLRGPSARVSGKIYLSIYLSIYLVFCLSPPALLPLLLLLSWFCRTLSISSWKRTIQPWFKV